MPTTLTRALADEAATVALGSAIAARLHPGLVVHLRGALGAGKTTLVRALGERGRVRSPTFSLLETYHAGGFDLAHLDLYRLEQPEELLHAGLHELLDGTAVVLIEWPERGAALLPPPDLDVHLAVDGAARTATLTAYGARAGTLLAAL